MCRFKFNKHKIYVHNLSNFEGIFLLRTLAKLGKVVPIINEGRIISLFYYKKAKWKNGIELHFRDPLRGNSFGYKL